MKLEDKARFFDQYSGQTVMRPPAGKASGNIFVPSHRHEFESMPQWLEQAYLELTPLDQITDEHAKAAWELFKCEANECGYNTPWEEFKRQLVEVGELAIPLFDFYGYAHNVIDKLRSYGYLISFDKYSCEELQELGWCKAKAPEAIDRSGTKGYEVDNGNV